MRFIVEEGRSPDEILTITFTKRAASEMKERIVRELRERGLLEAAQKAETGPIQTIHSFCERILRENCLEAGLDPEFEILDALEGNLRFRAAFRSAIVEALEEGGKASDLVRQWGDQEKYGGADETAAQLMRFVEDLIDHMTNRLTSPQDLIELGENGPAILQGWLEASPLGGAGGAQPQTASDLLALIQDFLADAKKPGKSKSKNLGALTMESLQSDLEATQGLCLLAASVWARLESASMTDQVFSFSMLETLTLRLLRESRVARERIARTYPIVLVDEAQDVNPVQYAIIDLLSQKSLMMVGDPQQAIYGFRHADLRLFVDREHSWPSLPLSRNFRSGQGILRFVDHLFRSCWGEGYKAMAQEESEEGFGASAPSLDFTGVEIWPAPEPNDRHGAMARRIADLIAEGTPPGDIAVLCRTARDLDLVLTEIRARAIPCRLVGETQKYFTRMEVRDFSNALAALSDGSNTHAWIAFLRSPFVGLSLDAVALLSRLGDIPAALASFESPVQEDQPKLVRLLIWMDEARETADRLAAWELMASLLSRSPLLENLAARPGGREMIANVRKLYSMACASPELGPLEFAEEVRTTRIVQHKTSDAPVEDSDQGLVTLLTMHKAKGLEFPVVVVDHLKKAGVYPSALALHPRGRAVCLSPDSGKSFAVRHLREIKQQLEGEESLRLFYVAVTRAREKLCVVKGKDHVMQSQIEAMSGESSRHRNWFKRE